MIHQKNGVFGFKPFNILVLTDPALLTKDTVVWWLYACKATSPADMEKGADTRTLRIFENCGNFFIVEDYAPLFPEENLFLVEMFDETSNVWHIYSL